MLKQNYRETGQRDSYKLTKTNMHRHKLRKTGRFGENLLRWCWRSRHRQACLIWRRQSAWQWSASVPSCFHWHPLRLQHPSETSLPECTWDTNNYITHSDPLGTAIHEQSLLTDNVTQQHKQWFLSGTWRLTTSCFYSQSRWHHVRLGATSLLGNRAGAWLRESVQHRKWQHLTVDKHKGWLLDI